MQVSVDLYLHHTCLPLLMRVLGPPPIKERHFYFYHIAIYFIHHTLCGSLDHCSEDDSFLLHITASRLALTSHVVKSTHHNSHMTLLTSVREPPWFACLYCIDSCASTTIYLMHVLVCLRAICSIHTARMTFGPLSTILTWGTAYTTIIG